MRRGLLVAIGALLVVDLAILAGVRLDRASDDIVLITLDERELRLVVPDGTSSAPMLRLAVHGDTSPGASTTEFQPPWIDQSQLIALGFDCSIWLADPRAVDHYRRQLARPAFVAFDVGTDAWKARLAGWTARLRAHAEAEREAGTAPGTAGNAPAIEQGIAAVTAHASRLVPIDISADKGALRGKYRTRPATLILPVVAGIAFLSDIGPHSRAEVQGRIVGLHPRTIVVPARFRSVFADLPTDGRARRQVAGELQHAPRYDVTLAIGRALRPWVVDARRLGGGASVR